MASPLLFLRHTTRLVLLAFALSSGQPVFGQLAFEVGLGYFAAGVDYGLPDVIRHDGRLLARQPHMTLAARAPVGRHTELGATLAVAHVGTQVAIADGSGAGALDYRSDHTSYVRFGGRVGQRLTNHLYLDGGVGLARDFSSGSPAWQVSIVDDEPELAPLTTTLQDYTYGELGLSLRGEVTFLRVAYHRSLTPAITGVVPLRGGGEVGASGHMQALSLGGGIHLGLRAGSTVAAGRALEGPQRWWSQTRLGRAGYVPVLEGYTTLQGLGDRGRASLRLMRATGAERLRLSVGLGIARLSMIRNERLHDAPERPAVAVERRYRQLSVPVAIEWPAMRGLHVGVELAPVVDIGRSQYSAFVREGLADPWLAAPLRLDAALSAAVAITHSIEGIAALRSTVTPIVAGARGAASPSPRAVASTAGLLSFGIGLRFRLPPPRSTDDSVI